LRKRMATRGQERSDSKRPKLEWREETSVMISDLANRVYAGSCNTGS
jgi:hypothetical protein